MEMDLLDDLQQARCADPFACLGLHQDVQSKGLSLTVWQPGAIAIEVLALEHDTSLGIMHSPQQNGLFSIRWPEQDTHFNYRLKIQYHDHELIRVDPYQFAQTTFNDGASGGFASGPWDVR
jgi:1,4-alpha-glucan branching enzyme